MYGACAVGYIDCTDAAGYVYVGWLGLETGCTGGALAAAVIRHHTFP